MTPPITCSACKQNWPRHPALEIRCPVCFADIGHHCVVPKRGRRTDPHSAREDEATARGLLAPCPGRNRHHFVKRSATDA